MTPATQAYRANITARFGNLTMQGLALRENCAMWDAMGRPIADATPKAVRRGEAKRAYRTHKANATKAQILERLTHPKTSEDLEADTGLSRNSIGAHLRRAAVEGLVFREVRPHRATLWYLASHVNTSQEAAA